MIELHGLTRGYGSTLAISRLSTAFRGGVVTGLLGPNGSGKTTTMRIIMGLVSPDEGKVTWDGTDLGPKVRLRFGYLPEERGLYPSMRVLDHLTYLGQLHGLTQPKALAASQTWLERLSLTHQAATKVGALSLGNQQRVQIAAALVHSPDALVLDEPYSGLDLEGIDIMTDVLDEAAANGCVVVFSSHQLDVVESRCESVVILNDGQVVTEGRVDDLTREGFVRLIVEVEDASDLWTQPMEGVCVSEMERAGKRARLILDDQVDPQKVLRWVQSKGHVVHFSEERRRLSEVFREAVSA